MHSSTGGAVAFMSCADAKAEKRKDRVTKTFAFLSQLRRRMVGCLSIISKERYELAVWLISPLFCLKDAIKI